MVLLIEWGTTRETKIISEQDELVEPVWSLAERLELGMRIEIVWTACSWRHGVGGENQGKVKARREEGTWRWFGEGGNGASRGWGGGVGNQRWRGSKSKGLCQNIRGAEIKERVFPCIKSCRGVDEDLEHSTWTAKRASLGEAVSGEKLEGRAEFGGWRSLLQESCGGKSIPSTGSRKCKGPEAERCQGGGETTMTEASWAKLRVGG